MNNNSFKLNLKSIKYGLLFNSLFLPNSFYYCSFEFYSLLLLTNEFILKLFKFWLSSDLVRILIWSSSSIYDAFSFYSDKLF